MNNTIRELLERKSVRAFTDEPITLQEKELIVHAACAAPTAGNQQMYSIIDVTDQNLKDELAITCDNQPFIAKAPLVLVFVADFRKWYDAFAEGGASPRRVGVGDLMLAVTDTAIAAQNAVMAAESMGIGSCYIGDIMEQREKHREMLKLPEYVFPAVMLVFGRPTEQQRVRVKPERHALGDIVSENTYQLRDGAQLRAMFAKNAGARTYEDWCAAFCARKYNSDFSREMTRSVGEYLKEYEVKYDE